MALPPLRPLGFGEILDGAFTLYRRNFVTFILTALIPTAVMIVGFVVLGGGFVAAATTDDPTALIGAAFGGLMLLGAVAIAAVLIMWGGLTREAAQSYTGQPTSVGDGMRAGLRAALPLLGSMFLIGIGGMVAFFAVALLGGILIGIFSSMGGAAAVVGMFLMFVVVMAAYLGIIGLLFAVGPAIVVEGAGPLEALERSFTLARGALGRVIGLMLVTILITYLPMMAVLAFTGGFAQMMNPQALPTPGQFITQQVLSMGVGILTTPFMVAVIVLLYFDRRVRTEALDVQMMTDQLAVAGD
ncbi:hypothetical protein [Longimicrobium sp.]|uniref:DUF7847 domain-containing protein n=1 Tax=Longimicrobium sp. TaxID=2029185 RepID=UPI003B3AEF50